MFELPSDATSHYTASSIQQGGPPEALVKKSSITSYPLVIRPITDEKILIRFHATFGEQMSPPIMPPGVNATIEPNSFILESGKNTTINLIVKVDEDALDGWYFMNIVGVWNTNDFSGTNISLKVGKGSDSLLFPADFIQSPLKQFKAGIKVEETQCKFDYLKLAIKLSNGMPACVKETSLSKLIERGWAKPV